LECIFDGGKHRTVKVRRVSYLLSAYDKCQKKELKRKRDTEKRTIIQGKAAVRDLNRIVGTVVDIRPLK